MKTRSQIVNEQFRNNNSNFVTLQERLNDALKLAPFFEAQLDAVVDEFKRRHTAPSNVAWERFEQIQMCKAIQVKMNTILIDASMQRNVNIRHILNILQFFRETMVMAIQVYEDPEKPGYYIAWDGQHTALALFIILTKVFGGRAASTMVPVVVYSVKQKLEIRRNFILLNGDAKEPLDFIDTYRQMVFGATVDGADDPAWIDAKIKNDYFEAAGLFATHKKFGDDEEQGAFTMLADTIMSKSEKTRKHPEVTRMFADYWVHLNQSRAVQAKEARQLYEYFNLCYEQGIKVDKTYILEFVNFCKEFFDANWSETGVFWSKVKLAYERWYSKANPDSFADVGLRGFTTEMRTGIPFLIAQLKKSTNLKTPSYDPNNGFTVDKKDLWE